MLAGRLPTTPHHSGHDDLPVWRDGGVSKSFPTAFTVSLWQGAFGVSSRIVNIYIVQCSSYSVPQSCPNQSEVCTSVPVELRGTSCRSRQ